MATGATRPPNCWPPSSGSSVRRRSGSRNGRPKWPQPWSSRSCNVTLIWTGNRPQGVRQLLTSGNGYDLVVGEAGTGKSTLLATARIGWEEAGFRVIGTAVAARTAADLEAGTGIPSSSLTHLLADLREAGGLTSRHVIVVDEASMVGSRTLDQLCRLLTGPVPRWYWSGTTASCRPSTPAERSGRCPKNWDRA